MSGEAEQLERQISRVLDGEATPAERRRLGERIRQDAAARALFDEYRALEAAVGDVLRTEIQAGPPAPAVRAFRFPALRVRLAKGLTVAAAAVLALAAWLLPPGANTKRGDAPQQAGMWSLHPEKPGDVVERMPVEFERPGVQLRGTQRDWIVIPDRQPGRYVVIEVDRVRTHVVTIQKDF